MCIVRVLCVYCAKKQKENCMDLCTTILSESVQIQQKTAHDERFLMFRMVLAYLLENYRSRKNEKMREKRRKNKIFYIVCIVRDYI